MHATIETHAAQSAQTSQPMLRIEGQDAWNVPQAKLTEAIRAANAVFVRYKVEPLECEKANKKLILGKDFLSKEETRLSLIWEEADYAAFNAITADGLSRDIDIYIRVR